MSPGVGTNGSKKWLWYTADLCMSSAYAADPFYFVRSSKAEDLQDRAVE